MIKNLSRRAVLLLALGMLVASCTAIASCGRPRSGNPDPGNRRLHTLEADPIFAGLPPGAVRISWQTDPAKYRGSAVFGGGWSGPGVILTFRSSQSALDVYHFYTERAHETGWTPTPDKKLSNGLIWSWSKQIDGSHADLGLTPQFDIHSVNSADSGIPRSYSLNAAT
jgi:hypothetical protein